MEDPDLYYKVRTDSTDVTPSRFHPKAGKALTEKKWKAAFDKQGRVDISKVLMRIQGGGVDPSIRGEVWEFLLGCFDADSGYAERAALRNSRRQKYFQLKAECQIMDSAVGSGVVVILPRINEDESTIDNHKQREESRNEPSLSDHGGANVRDDFNKRDVLPRSLRSLLREDDTRAYHSEQIQAITVENVKQVEDSRVDKGKLAQLHRSQAIKFRHGLGQESQSDSATMSIGLNQEKCASSGALQAKKMIQWRQILHQIGLDVVRTDRMLQFYEKPSNLAKLWDILAIYAWIDPDIGYCQGMSDLCSPMVVLFQHEEDAFWCFERLMSRLRENFRCTDQSVGVQKQLANLGSILRIIDPKLHNHLDDIGGGSYIFAFRMLMVLFRREFSFADSLYLWEIMWAVEYDPDVGLPESGFQQQQIVRVTKRDVRSGWIRRNGKSIYRWGKFERQNIKYGNGVSHEIPFVVFCAASVFESQRIQLQQAPALDEVLKILNEITGKLDAKKACKDALKIHKKYLLKAKKSE